MHRAASTSEKRRRRRATLRNKTKVCAKNDAYYCTNRACNIYVFFCFFFFCFPQIRFYVSCVSHNGLDDILLYCSFAFCSVPVLIVPGIARDDVVTITGRKTTEAERTAETAAAHTRPRRRITQCIRYPSGRVVVGYGHDQIPNSSVIGIYISVRTRTVRHVGRSYPGLFDLSSGTFAVFFSSRVRVIVLRGATSPGGAANAAYRRDV